MAIKLIAEFLGLMAIVPSVDCHPNGNVCTVDAVVIDGSYPMYPVGAHDALLVADADDVCTKRTDPTGARCNHQYSDDPDYYFPSGYRKLKAVWRISRSEVEIVVDGKTEQDVRLRDDERGEDLQPGSDLTRGRSNSWRDLGWLASVYRASNDDPAERLLVDSDYLKPPTHSSEWPVDALIRIRSGLLSTGLPQSSVLVNETWDFVTDRAGNYFSHTRALSDHVILEKSVESLVALHLRPFPRSAYRHRSVFLKAAQDMNIVFSALPAVESPTERARHVHDTDDDPDAIAHFRAYYNILKSPPDRVRIPWRTKRDKKKRPTLLTTTDPRALSSQDCPPALARVAKE